MAGDLTRVSVVVATRGAPHLGLVLSSLEQQTLERRHYEVVVVDDDASHEARATLRAWHDGVGRRHVRQQRCDLVSARNLGLFVSTSPIVLFLDDDQVPEPDALAEHLRAHRRLGDLGAVVVGTSRWRPDTVTTPLMRFLAGIERLPLGYPDNPRESDPGPAYASVRQLSVRRDLLARFGIFDRTFGPLAGFELACRLRPRGIHVCYWPDAISQRVGEATLAEWLDSCVAEGRSIARLAERYPDDGEVQGHCRVEQAQAVWQRVGPQGERVQYAAVAALAEQVAAGAADPATLRALWSAYRNCFELARARGVVEVAGARQATPLGGQRVGAAGAFARSLFKRAREP